MTRPICPSRCPPFRVLGRPPVQLPALHGSSGIHLSALHGLGECQSRSSGLAQIQRPLTCASFLCGQMWPPKTQKDAATTLYTLLRAVISRVRGCH